MRGEYYINIPSKVLHNKNLKPNSKILYGEIARLSKKDGYCYASNKYLGELLNINEKSVSRLLKELKDGKYISTFSVANVQTNQAMRVISLNK